MADPSMDKQELYVAASRSREETYLYATPEIQTHREEIAPALPHLREGIPHIAEAAERDRAQLAAHDEALRSQFSGLPTEELVARRAELRGRSHRGEPGRAQRRSLQERIERAREHLEGFEAEREAAQALPRRERSDELARIDTLETGRAGSYRAARSRAGGDARRSGDAARRELAVADQVLAQRRSWRSSPRGSPRPPTSRPSWGRGRAIRPSGRHGIAASHEIERYRQEHGIKDPSKAFGREAKRGAERARQQAATRRLQESR